MDRAANGAQLLQREDGTEVLPPSLWQGKKTAGECASWGDLFSVPPLPSAVSCSVQVSN